MICWLSEKNSKVEFVIQDLLDRLAMQDRRNDSQITSAEYLVG
jgi:hypothetical protein